MESSSYEHEESPLITSAAFADALERLVASGRFYAAFDGSETPSVAEKARELGPRGGVCLYRPQDDDEELADVAPYLFHVTQDLLPWVRALSAEDPSACIFALADTNLEGVRRHLRRFLVVQSPAGTKMNFRFFDPRVLVTWLDCCTPQELDDFYGPVSEFGIPTEDTLGALFWKRRVEGQMRRRTDVLLKLRPAQMRAFAQASDERFVDRTTLFLQSEFPDARKQSRGTLKMGVADQIAKARLHGFTTEIQLVTYVVTAWLLGENFDEEFPAVKETLASPVMSPSDKATWLSQFTEKLFRTLSES
ncbi:MAG TPA: DUF4123 domain-containing protein [Polyangium sp.]|nr:DUF4123 domain-containing protein [Polyangium sp.]